MDRSNFIVESDGEVWRIRKDGEMFAHGYFEDGMTIIDGGADNEN